MTDRRGWLVAFFIAATAHAGVYRQFSASGISADRAVAPPLVSISLLAAPAKTVHPVTGPGPVVPVTPLPVPIASKPKPKPEPKPRLERVKPKQVVEQPVPASPPVARTVAGTPVPEQPVVAELPLELPRADAAYLRNPPPAYPKRLLRRGVEGVVLVSAQVQDDGRCSQVSLKETSGFRLFDEAAVSAVREWQFVPARKGRQTVVAWVDVPIAFRITGN